MPFANWTLSSALPTPEAVQATLFLPVAGEAGYYRSSRFDHGTMLGDVRTGGRTAFCSGFWRQPHDPMSTEAGIGLAAEWGCAVDGAVCPAGWSGAPDTPIANGVLGYDEAGAGDPFLKIGVGALLKGSHAQHALKVALLRCAACNASDPHDAYQFNSPYRFASAPSWRVRRLDTGTVELSHEAAVRGHGYALRRTVAVGSEQTLSVKTWLQNRGRARLTTPYYSHSLLSIDRHGPGPGWSLSLGSLDVNSYSDSPPSWAAPLGSYFQPKGAHGLWATARPSEPAKVKALFPPSAANRESRGEYTVAGGGLLVHSALRGPLPLYAYNLYVEPTTLSPEPIQLVDLAPGEAATLTQTVSLLAGASSKVRPAHYQRGAPDRFGG